jgi:hypothetical protein
MRIFNQTGFEMRNAILRVLLVATLFCMPGLGVIQAQTPVLAPGLALEPAGQTLSQTPAVVRNGTALLVGHYEPTNMLRLAITLAPPHPAEEAAFLEELQDKSSPQFHQFLSAEDWNTRFGPSAADEQAVVDWAQSQGLTITYRYGHRLAVDVEAQAGTIEKAFGVTINKYQVALPDGTLGAVQFSADRDPLLPAALGAVVSSVQGLNSFERVEPASGPESNVAEPDYVAGPAIARTGSLVADALGEKVQGELAPEGAIPEVTPPNLSYINPDDIWSVPGYDYLALMNQGHCCNPLGNAGQSPVQTSIAVSTFGPLALSDVAGFQAGFPYLAYNVSTIAVDGGLSCSPSAGTCSGESSLDTEWSLSMANSRGAASNTAKVYVYIAPNGDTTDVWNHVLDDNLTRVMTQSWGCAEVPQQNGNGCTYSTMQAQDNVLKTMIGQGWTVLSSSGDQGATGACSDALLVIYPASDPNVTAVGGTELGIYSNTKGFYSEVAWTGNTGAGSCSGNNGGSTGGYSTYWGVPSYQSGMGFSKRSVPDVALNAYFGQNVYVNNGWAHLGGTSIATPMFAGFMAQLNAYLLSLGKICGSNNNSSCAPMGNADNAIYAEGNHRSAGHYPFYDILTGCNSNDIAAKDHLTPYCAHAGFDQVTGWGSANMLQLAWALNWEDVPANGIPNTVFSGPATGTWYNSNQNVSWTINDYPGTAPGAKGTGIAGFTQGWDSIPGDAGSEANQGGASNSFYTGPEFVNVKAGCLALASGQGCSGGVSQGCHTAHVRGWNNMGFTTGDSTYGPICYDTVAPTLQLGVTSAANQYGGWATSATLSAAVTDSGGSAASGVAKLYYALNNSNCKPTDLGACSYFTTSSHNFAVTASGVNTYTVFGEDHAGNFSVVGTQPVWIDVTAPVTTAGISGVLSQGVYEGPVTLTLKAVDSQSGVKAAFYSWNGGPFVVYTGPVTLATVGKDTLSFYAVDNVGNAEAKQTETLTIAVAPTLTLLGTTPNPAAIGVSVMLQARVTTTGTGTPTGTVTFKNGTATLGTVALTNGVATLSTSALAVGSDQLTATYSGAAGYAAGTSFGVTELIVASATTTTISATQVATSSGANVTFTIKVVAASGPVPTGTVSVTLAGKPQGTVTLTSSGTYTYTTAVPDGIYTFVATYKGDTNDKTSVSPALVLTVP